MTDSLGKEELLVSLAEYFNTLVTWSYIFLNENLDYSESYQIHKYFIN